VCWTVFKSQLCGFAAQKYPTKPQLKNCRLARRYGNHAMKNTLFLIFCLVISSCASNLGLPQDDRFPVSNKGKNIEYYKLSTKMDWPVRVKSKDLKNYVSWNHAIDLILDNQVETTFQAHSLRVSLKLKSGEWVSTLEPSIDTISIVLRKCGLPCENIGEITE
jgi:hypothetical protein